MIKKYDLVRTRSGHIFLVVDDQKEVNFGLQGRLIVKLWSNESLIYDIENDDSKKPTSASTAGYLSEWGFEDTDNQITRTISGASWNKDGQYSYDTDPLDVVYVGKANHLDRVKLDASSNDDKVEFLYLDYGTELQGWFKQEKYTNQDVKAIDEARWANFLRK